jgi:hypothetical protein
LDKAAGFRGAGAIVITQITVALPHILARHETDASDFAQDSRVVISGKTGQTAVEIVTAPHALGLGVRCGEDKKEENGNTEEHSFHTLKPPDRWYVHTASGVYRYFCRGGTTELWTE